MSSSSFTLPPPLGDYAHLLPPSWKSVITSWLAEDTPSFDYGGFVVGEELEEAFLWGKSEVRSTSQSSLQLELTCGNACESRVF